MDCFNILKERGYDLGGYSPEVYIRLSENDLEDADQCEGLLAYLEAQYG